MGQNIFFEGDRERGEMMNTAKWGLAAVYHDKEQQQTIMQQEAENTRQEAVILGMTPTEFRALTC